MLLAVVTLALVGAAAAGAAPPGTFDGGDIEVGPLNSFCPDYTTPEPFHFRTADLVLEDVTIHMQVIVDGSHVFQRTTIKGSGTDGAGTSFAISGRFEVDALFVEGDFYVFEPHLQGTGTVELIRQDKTVASGTAEMSLSKSTGAYEVRPQTLTCAKRVPVATGTTKLLADGDVVLFEASGVAHRLHGAYPAITEQLTELVGRTVTVYGTPRRSDIPNYPILVQDFELVPGGALDGDVVVVTGPTRRLADGDIIVDDEFGHGHRLRPTATASASELEALVGQRVRIQGRANVTNADSRTNWPIDVDSIAAV
jgi:hypothetical protein